MSDLHVVPITWSELEKLGITPEEMREHFPRRTDANATGNFGPLPDAVRVRLREWLINNEFGPDDDVEIVVDAYAQDRFYLQRKAASSL